MFTIEEYAGADGQPLRYGKLFNPDKPDSGRPLLYVPGLGGSVKGALHFLEQLLPFYSPIYGPDLRGFGLNPLDEPLRDSHIILDDLEAFHKTVGLDRHPDLTLCGLSLGGVIATRLAVTHPERYRKLILLAPAYKPHPKSFTWRYVLRNVCGRILKGPACKTELPYDVTAITRNEEILNDPQYTQQPPLILTAGFMLSLRSLCLTALKQTADIRIPTLMVIPGQDVVCDPRAMREGFARIPATTPKVCKEYEDFYHDVLFETGHTDIADEVLAWSQSFASLATSSSSM